MKATPEKEKRMQRNGTDNSVMSKRKAAEHHHRQMEKTQ